MQGIAPAIGSRRWRFKRFSGPFGFEFRWIKGLVTIRHGMTCWDWEWVCRFGPWSLVQERRVL